MGYREMTLGRRIIQTILEIIIGVILVLGVFFLIMYLLYGNRVICSYSIKKELDLDYMSKENSIVDYLNAKKVNYVIFCKDGDIKRKNISDSHLITAQECLKEQKILNTYSGEYLFFSSTDFVVVVRIPYVPEFTNIALEERYHFNALCNNIFLLLCFLIFCNAIVRLIRQTKKELLELESVILDNGDRKIRTGNPPKIMEIKRSINQVNDMKKTLIHLIEKEKAQKKDLLFQVSALSHDIRTPLTVIKGNAGLLEYCDSKEEVQECIQYINAGVESIEDYIEQIISYAKWSYYPEEKKEIRINELIQDTVKEVEGYKKDIEFEVKYENGLEIVFCSKSNIERALINIVINALRHAKSKVSLTVILGEVVEFRIYNDGERMSDELIHNIGKLFFVGDKKRNTQDRHYGIGLYFAKNVALDHGGYLKCENLENGVQFSLGIQKQ